MHSERVDRINKLVEQRIGGMLDVAAVEETGAAMRAAVRSLNSPPGAHLSLYDLSELGPVGDDVVLSALRQWGDARFTCVRARKVALVVPSTLSRLTLTRRLQERDNMRLFATRAEAMRWLFAS